MVTVQKWQSRRCIGTNPISIILGIGEASGCFFIIFRYFRHCRQVNLGNKVPNSKLGIKASCRALPQKRPISIQPNNTTLNPLQGRRPLGCILDYEKCSERVEDMTGLRCDHTVLLPRALEMRCSTSLENPLPEPVDKLLSFFSTSQLCPLPFAPPCQPKSHNLADTTLRLVICRRGQASRILG